MLYANVIYLFIRLKVKKKDKKICQDEQDTSSMFFMIIIYYFLFPKYVSNVYRRSILSTVKLTHTHKHTHLSFNVQNTKVCCLFMVNLWFFSVFYCSALHTCFIYYVLCYFVCFFLFLIIMKFIHLLNEYVFFLPIFLLQ